MVSPRRMNRPARVTMNDGRPVRTTTMPLIQPTAAATAKARMMHSHKGQPQTHRRDREHHAGGADHRADREVELAADHQERGRHGDDAELGRHLEEGDDAQGREHAGAAGGDGEEQEHQDGAGDGAQLGAGHQACGRAGSRPGARRAPAPWSSAMFARTSLDGGPRTPAAAGRRGDGDCVSSGCPPALSSITWAAVSLVTKPGPGHHRAGRHQAVLVVERQQLDRQVALQELLLVDREQHLAVADRLQHARRQVEGAELDLVQHVELAPAPRASARPPTAPAPARRRCRRWPRTAP